MTRRNPPVTYSSAAAVIRPPRCYDRDAIIAIFYRDIEALREEYDRSVRWNRIPGLKAFVRTAYLEKDVAGQPFINLGWRRVPCVGAAGFAEPYELPQERIAVPVVLNGKNRGRAINQIRSAESLRIIFHHLEHDDPELFPERIKRLRDGTLWCADETEQIELVGISIFGRLIRPEGGYLMQQK